MTPGQVWWLIEDSFPAVFKKQPAGMSEVVAHFKAQKAKESREAEHA